MSPGPNYPRPDFTRPNLNWQSLNGEWDFLFDDEDMGASTGTYSDWHSRGLPDSASSKDDGAGASSSNTKRTIQVPFVVQSKASGIHETGVHEVLWYERKISDIRTNEELERGHRLLLRFGAVDYHAKVWVNGSYVGEHIGGHVPFDLDITNAVFPDRCDSNVHRLTVRVYDSAYDLCQPRGKQYWGPKPESIFYTPSSGIWQSVWLESVPRLRIANSSSGTILRSHEIECGNLDARIAVLGRTAREQCSVELEARLAEVVVSKSGKKDVPRDENFVRFKHSMRLSEEQRHKLPEEIVYKILQDDTTAWRNRIALWSPEQPTLYDLTIRLFDSSGRLVDEVETTTGMRSLNWTTGDGTFRLNGKPYFHSLVLDQGYWPETLMTPPSQEALKKDIELAKSMGFNGCRKHQKVEDPVFLYWADRLGFMVWGEMASCFNFSIPGIDRFNSEWMEAVKRDINHPSLVAWTTANESWGYPDLGNNVRQRDHLRSLYHMTKTLDWTRPVNGNCGWEHVVTDLSTFHSYADAEGMRERCSSLQSVLGSKGGRRMFLAPIHGNKGEYDPGSTHERGAPVLCTEFGGVNIAAAGENDPTRKENWGYTTVKDSEDLLKRVEGIVMATVESGVVCGVVWTQL